MFNKKKNKTAKKNDPKQTTISQDLTYIHKLLVRMEYACWGMFIIVGIGSGVLIQRYQAGKDIQKKSKTNTVCPNTRHAADTVQNIENPKAKFLLMVKKENAR